MTAINIAKECFYERATTTKKLNLCEPGGDCSVQLSILCNFPTYLRDIPHGSENNKLHAWINYFFFGSQGVVEVSGHQIVW